MGNCASIRSATAPLPLETGSASNLNSLADRSQKQVLPLPVPSGMPSTPMGKDKEVFKYYCPICFVYFKDIFRSSCCRNYVCENCALDHISTKSKNDEEYYSVPLTRLDNIPCPSCGSDHVLFEKVAEQEVPRSYQESPHTKNLLLHTHGDPATDRSARRDKDAAASELEVLGEEGEAQLNQSMEMETNNNNDGEAPRERASSYALMSAMSAELPPLPHEPSRSMIKEQAASTSPRTDEKEEVKVEAKVEVKVVVKVDDKGEASAEVKLASPSDNDSKGASPSPSEGALVRVETAVQEDGSVHTSVTLL